MTKKWTKPIITVATLISAGAIPMLIDGIAQAAHPLDHQEGHDSFELVLVSTATGVTVMVQNTITGDVIELPPIPPVKRHEGTG
jgi:hypothetical protein